MKYKLFLIPTIIIIATSCVSPRLFNDEKTRREDSEKQVEDLKLKNKNLTEQLNELTANFTKAKAELDNNALKIKSFDTKYSDLKEKFDKLNKQYTDLLKDVESRIKSGDNETKALLKNIQQMQNDLQYREDKLKDLEASLNEKKRNLELLNAEVDQKNKDLSEKESKIAELQRILAAKDSASLALKKKISAALLGFEGNGLSVERKNGKVYVSMDETLLFSSGSDKVNPRGISALEKLTEVLAKNTEVNILVEGHTDDVGESDYNWDLSVKRATSVVKIMTKNSALSPKRITASGHGEFVPLNEGTTPEIRAKNRRTEIILEPKIEELLNLINN